MQKLLSVIIVLSSLVFFSIANADNQSIPLNRITLQINAEKWVSTQSAQIIVAIDASVSETELGKVRAEMLQKLSQLANTDWHITAFDRNLDQSGLEHLAVQAEARLSENALNDLRDKTKALNKPGMSFTISAINFIPTLVELEQARNDLRNEIYAMAKMEADKMNKLYSGQQYFIHAIIFGSPYVPGPIRPMMMTSNAVTTAAAGVSVSNKIQMSATVTFAQKISS